MIRRVLFAIWQFANPKRQPLKICAACSTANEPDRTSCIGCGASF